jgi:hypothetical protein
MKNRLPDYLPVPRGKGESSPDVSRRVRNFGPRQIASRWRQINGYVQTHPVTALSAMFCMGVILGWAAKRR